MRPSAEFIFRILGGFILAGLGLQLGLYLDARYGAYTEAPFRVIMPLLGMLMGLVLTPYVTTRPAAALRRKIAALPAPSLFSALAGLVFGLFASALLSIPLWLIPLVWLRTLLAMVFTGLMTYASIMIALTRQEEVWNLLLNRNPTPSAKYDVVDSSMLIDGRLPGLLRLGVLERTLLIPRFVLEELQAIADDREGMRRRRGRLGLEHVRQLRELFPTQVLLSEVDVPDTDQVDMKLVLLARQLGARLLTVDYNLAQLAKVYGVQVLNLRELQQILQIPVRLGDTLHIVIEERGRNPRQGVGFLDDGTMVVVEDGEPYLGQEVEVTVTKVLPTQGGRIIFAQLKGNRGGKRHGPSGV